MSDLSNNDVPASLRSFTIAQLLVAENICRSTYYDLRKRGLGPDETRFPDSPIVRITPEARVAWHKRLAEIAKTKEAQLERERFIAQCTAAGKKAAELPKHISNKRAAAGRAAAANKRRRGR